MTRRRGLSRRQFLAGATAAGVAAGLPGLLLGCGDGDGDGPPATPTPTPVGGREARTLHFDFSFAPHADLRLVALNSPSHRAAPRAHGAASRRTHRRRLPLLAGVPDHRLTHFLEDVDLPADSFQHLWVTGTHAASGDPALLALYLHVPSAVQRAMAARRAAGPPLAKLRAYGLTAPPDDLYPGIDQFITPWDTATALVFHHPEVMNLDLAAGTELLHRIQTLPCAAGDAGCAPALDRLAFRLAARWPARTTPGGWATLVPLTDVDGTPVLDDETGEPVHRIELDDEIAATVEATARAVLASAYDDPQFEGSTWHALTGVTERRPPPAVRPAGQVAGPPADFAVSAEHPPGTTVHGVQFVDVRVVDAAARTVEIAVRNHYLRSLSVYVQFANQAGDLPVIDPEPYRDTPRAKDVGIVFTNDSLLGIPLTGDLVRAQRLLIDVPAEASTVRVYFGSLGLGGEAFCPEAMWGSLMTLAFNIGLPTIFLAAGAVGQASDAISAGWKELFQNTRGFARLSDFFIRAASVTVLASAPTLGRGIFGSAGSNNAQAFLLGLANGLLQLLLNLSPALLVWLTSKVSRSAAVQAFPFIGIGTRVLSAAANLSDITQSVTEVLASPALFTNTLSLTMTTRVVVERDPDDFRFPARARHCTVTLTYDQASKVAHTLRVAVEPDRVDPLVLVFDDVPAGGQVTVDVVLTTDDDWIVGRSSDAQGALGPLGPLENTPEGAGEIRLSIRELLIPLTADTRYQHDLELAIEAGRHVWVERAAPAATRADLCQGQDARLCDAGAITVNQRTGMVGYTFQAGGQGVPFCGESGGGTMHVAQNLFLAADPDRALKRLACGFRQPAGLAYDRLGAADGRHFLIQPAGDGYDALAVRLDAETPLPRLCDDGDATPDCTPLTWGRFSQPLDAFAVVPTGFIVGVNRTTHKMEILALPPAPLRRAEAPEAVPFAVQKGGPGSRAGLLLAPVAVAVADATVLVLEDGNRRVQAFDVSANPVLRFANGTSSVMPLRDDGAAATYLDLAVEATGYVYVLSYVGDGLRPEDYRLDLYTPAGDFLARTTGVAAARLAVDTFRNVYTLNYETLQGAGRVEPSLSQWTPSTPS